MQLPGLTPQLTLWSFVLACAAQTYDWPHNVSDCRVFYVIKLPLRRLHSSTCSCLVITNDLCGQSNVAIETLHQETDSVWHIHQWPSLMMFLHTWLPMPCVYACCCTHSLPSGTWSKLSKFLLWVLDFLRMVIEKGSWTLHFAVVALVINGITYTFSSFPVFWKDAAIIVMCRFDAVDLTRSDVWYL